MGLPKFFNNQNLKDYANNESSLAIDFIGEQQINTRIGKPILYEIGLVTPNESSPVSIYALYFKGQIGYNYKGNSYSLIKVSFGMIDVSYSTKKLFSALPFNSLINPNLYIGMGAVNLYASLGYGISGKIELASVYAGVQLGDSVDIGMKFYIGFGFKLEFDGGIQIGLGLGFGFDFSINVDVYDLIN